MKLSFHRHPAALTASQPAKNHIVIQSTRNMTIWYIMNYQMGGYMANTTQPEKVRTKRVTVQAAQNPFATLRSDLKAGRDPVAAIRMGLDADLLTAAGDYFEVPAARIRAITRVPDTTAHRLIKRHALLDSAASERLWRLADVAAMAEDVFEDETSAKQWLRSPNQAFLGGAPIDYLDTEPGAKAVRQVLNAISTGGVL
jgi:putative toxin-antitoxin system antitoxin component (TIGR02293 family)